MAKKSDETELDVIALAKKLLRAKKDTHEEIEERTFWDDAEAHDNELQEQVRRSFVRKMKAIQKVLSSEFGEPSKVGKDEHDAIPRNGILEYAIWDVGRKSLFVAASHEDRELPCLILLGVTKTA